MDFKNFLGGIELPHVKTDVEVNPSASFTLLVGAVLLGLFVIFGKK